MRSIANALKTAYERGESALASDDPAEILDFAANVAFALTNAQAEKAVADEAAANQAAADEVIAKINAIGEVEYTDESKDKIDAARAAYDALTDDQKALVENADVLTAAEARYAELKAAAETPDEPDAPETPAKEENHDPCPICGKHHTGSIIDNFIGVLHGFIWILKSFLLIAA